MGSSPVEVEYVHVRVHEYVLVHAYVRVLMLVRE